MTNERLRGALRTNSLNAHKLADKAGVARKTAERWVTQGRIPHRTHREEVAELLGTSESYLWPDADSVPLNNRSSAAELVEYFPSRSAVPNILWNELIDDCVESFDFLAFAGLFLPEQNDAFVDRLVTKAHDGVRVRLLVGDPQGQAVATRGLEEGTGDGMAQRSRLVLRYLTEGIETPGFDIRLHDTTLYASIYRSDETALVNTHIYGSPASHNPVLHLHRIPGGRIFDQYMRSFDKIWADAKVLDMSAS